jgi:regulation of enolase protein 1 (concanavalin A-like superfamily)
MFLGFQPTDRRNRRQAIVELSVNRTWHDNSDLLVEAVEGSDFWRSTAYGLVHDSGHAFLVDFSA